MGMNAPSSSSSRPVMSEINVTPLVDVMLVLLVIFMVTAPMMQQGIKVDLPKEEAPALSTQDVDRLIISLTKEGKAYVGKTEVTLDKLTDVLRNNAKLKVDKELYLHADQSLPYAVIVKVMAAARAGGAENIGMITEPAAPSI
jgi:biopolymer transport protein TolR